MQRIKPIEPELNQRTFDILKKKESSADDKNIQKYPARKELDMRYLWSFYAFGAPR